MLNAVRHLACCTNSIASYAVQRLNEAGRVLHRVQHDPFFKSYSYALLQPQPPVAAR